MTPRRVGEIMYDRSVEDEPPDERNEWKLRAGAVPVALALALVFHSCDAGHFAQRTALTMPLHELGHAVTAWWCGIGAIPSLWKTLIPESRGTLTPLVILALEGALFWRGWTTNRTALLALAIGLGVLQFVGTVGSSADTAALAITFGGDAGAMVLGTALMLTFFVGPGSRLRTGGLRFGLLAIGAAGLVDTFATWWRARADPSVIPYGEIEGVGLSDPSKLDEIYGWTTAQLVGRYVTVGVLCFVVLAVVWGWATWRARRDANPI